MRFPRLSWGHRDGSPGGESTSVARLADDGTPRSVSNRADGLSAAIALLTATVPMPGVPEHSRDETLLAVVPEDCVELIDLFAGLYAVAHLLLLELSESSGEALTAPLQRLAIATAARRGTR